MSTAKKNLLGQRRLSLTGISAATWIPIVLDVDATVFVDGNVATGTDRITLAGHGFETDDKVGLSTTGVLPTGLAALTEYFVKKIDANTIELYDLPAAATTEHPNPGAQTIIDITAAAGGGNHTIVRIGFDVAIDNYFKTGAGGEIHNEQSVVPPLVIVHARTAAPRDAISAAANDEYVSLVSVFTNNEVKAPDGTGINGAVLGNGIRAGQQTVAKDDEGIWCGAAAIIQVPFIPINRWKSTVTLSAGIAASLQGETIYLAQIAGV